MTGFEHPLAPIGGRVAVCFPAQDPDVARAVWEAGAGAAIPTVEATRFADEDDLRGAVHAILEVVPVVSVALGGGADGVQWRKVLAGGRAGAQHLNQPFSTAGRVKGAAPGCWVNGVVAPTGTAGRVRLGMVAGHGPVLPVEQAVSLLREAGADALKFHPAGRAGRHEEAVAACAAAAAGGLRGFEPAGGVDAATLTALTRDCLRTGIPLVLPHVFSAVIDPATGRTDATRVRRLLEPLRALAAAPPGGPH